MHFGPNETPRVVWVLIIVTSCITLLSALTQNLSIWLGIVTLQELLSLSWYGLANFFVWQPISYLFVQETYQGIQLFFLLTWIFNMYILWILGSTLTEQWGKRHFLLLYFLSGVVTGLFAVSVMLLTGHHSMIAGPTSALLALVTVWTLSYPEDELMLFFAIPIKAKWLLVAIIGGVILIPLSRLDFVLLSLYLGAILFGYLYALIELNLRSPFSWMHPIDQMVSNWKGKPLKNPTTMVEEDDLFIDQMLTKISKYGESSLTTSERLRMQRISNKKMKR